MLNQPRLSAINLIVCAAELFLSTVGFHLRNIGALHIHDLGSHIWCKINSVQKVSAKKEGRHCSFQERLEVTQQGTDVAGSRNIFVT